MAKDHLKEPCQYLFKITGKPQERAKDSCGAVK